MGNHRDGDTAHSHRPVILPILPVRSLEASEALHRAMGLEVERYDDTYAWVRLGGHEVWHLRVAEDLDPATNPTTVFAFVEALEEAHAGLAVAGLDPTPVVETPWGMRETSVRDADGNRFRLGWWID